MDKEISESKPGKSRVDVNALKGLTGWDTTREEPEKIGRDVENIHVATKRFENNTVSSIKKDGTVGGSKIA